MLRTGWVVVRRTTLASPSGELDRQGGVGDHHGDGLVLMHPTEGDLLPGDHDDPGVGGAPLHPDGLGRGPRRRPGRPESA